MRAVLVAVVALELAGCFRGSAPPPVAPPRTVAPRAVASSDPLAFLPADSDLVVVVDMRTLLASSAWQRIEPLLLARVREPLQLFKSTCGFDPIVGLRRISIGLRDLDATRPSGVMVVKGIDRAATLACVKRPQLAGTTITVERDLVIVHNDTGTTALGFVDATTAIVLVGKDASAATMATVMARGAPLRGSPALGELLSQIPSSDPIWLAVNGTASVLQKGGLGVRPRALVGSLNLTDGAAAQLRLRLETPDQANNLSSLAQAQVGMAATFFDEIAITAEDVDVVVRMRMTQDQLHSMLGLLGPSITP